LLSQLDKQIQDFSHPLRCSVPTSFHLIQKATDHWAHAFSKVMFFSSEKEVPIGLFVVSDLCNNQQVGG